MPDLSKAACDARIRMTQTARTVSTVAQEMTEFLSRVIPQLHVVDVTIQLTYVNNETARSTDLGEQYLPPHYELEVIGIDGYQHTVFFYPQDLLDEETKPPGEAQ